MNPPERTLNPWPWAIVAACAVFATGMIAFVIFSTFHRVDLVTPDYYEREIRYQGELDRMNRALALEGQVHVDYDAAARAIRLRLPAAHARASGRIHFYRPSAARLDREVRLDLDAQGIQTLDVADLLPGPWLVRLEWTTADKEFLQETRVVIPKARS